VSGFTHEHTHEHAKVVHLPDGHADLGYAPGSTLLAP
jgi:hypothetical protein